jgi:predicted branched-subunit amino acid permease
MHITTSREPAGSARAGARAILPLLVGVTPLGLVVGIQIAATGLSPAAGLAGSVTIYGASAQLAAIDLLHRDAGWAVVVLAVVVVNLRLALYSAALGGPWRGTTTAQRALFSYLLVDPSYAVGSQGYQSADDGRPAHRHYLGAAVTLWVGWQLLTVTGLVFGALVPPGLHLEFAVPLCLLAIVVGQATEGRTQRAAVVAAVVAVVAHGLPLGAGTPVAILAGIVAGATAAPAEEVAP